MLIPVRHAPGEQVKFFAENHRHEAKLGTIVRVLIDSSLTGTDVTYVIEEKPGLAHRVPAYDIWSDSVAIPLGDVTTAVQILTMAFRQDPDFLRTWKDNVVVHVHDQLANLYAHIAGQDNLHKKITRGVDNFFDLLLKQTNTSLYGKENDTAAADTAGTAGNRDFGSTYGQPESMDPTPDRAVGGEREPFRVEVIEPTYEENQIGYLHGRLHTPEGKLAWISLIKFTTEHYRKSTPYEVLDWLMSEFERIKPIL